MLSFLPHLQPDQAGGEPSLTTSTAAADAELAPFLSNSIGEPVFTAECATWQDGNPVTFARMSFGRGYRMTTRF